MTFFAALTWGFFAREVEKSVWLNNHSMIDIDIYCEMAAETMGLSRLDAAPCQDACPLMHAYGYIGGMPCSFDAEILAQMESRAKATHDEERARHRAAGADRAFFDMLRERTA